VLLTLDSGRRTTEAQRFDTIDDVSSDFDRQAGLHLHIRVEGSLQEPFDLAGVGGVLCFFLDLKTHVS